MLKQIDITKLKQADAAATLAKDSITVAIEQSAANAILANEALKIASFEIAQAKTLVNQVKSQLAPPAKSTVFDKVEF
ncbi:hypothetical protein [Bacillus sp. Marseille-P3661]|uniref:hypothetical protein n=1 Tax=Bacillus sp. Marseille-P3661 TaxID=1936234 RepID=UPI000C83F067|nr:hypothetical protein [Bacillus sp. Marseille-P3661]